MATKLNLYIDQGSDFETSIEVTDDDGEAIDLSTFTGRSHIRKHYTSSTFYTFSVSTSSAGTITLTMSANTSTGIPAGRYVYDLELVSSSNLVSRVVEGIVTISPEVTR